LYFEYKERKMIQIIFECSNIFQNIDDKMVKQIISIIQMGDIWISILSHPDIYVQWKVKIGNTLSLYAPEEPSSGRVVFGIWML
jgi:hypothetical protein